MEKNKRIAKNLSILLFTVLLSVSGQAAVLAYESFGFGTNGSLLHAYSGQAVGLTGAWSVSGDSSNTIMVTPPTFGTELGILYGYEPEAIGGAQHSVRKTGWSIATAVRLMNSVIDLTVDRTVYMSFFAACDGSDFIGQVGFSNAAHELMAGNAWSWGGLTSYYGTLGTSVTTNQDGTTLGGAWGSGDRNAFFVIRFEKTHSATTDDLTVTVDFYDLGTVNPADITAGPTRSRTIQLTGISDVFDSLAFKVGGWPNIDEIRLGETWADVVGYIPPPSEDPIIGTFFESGTGEEYTTVINGHLTLPGTASTGTIGVPGWGSSQTVWHGDTGTRSGGGSDGDNWYFQEKITDGPIWNITQTRMVEGRSYTFLADVQGRWDCNRVTMSIVAGEDPNTGLGDPNIPLASVTHVIGGNGVWYHDLFVSYTATEADTGKFIGVKFEGGSTTNVNNSWIWIDNVRLMDGLLVNKHGPKEPLPADRQTDVKPGDITLSWVPSNDPNMTHQKLYCYMGVGTLNFEAYNSVSGITLSNEDTSYSIGYVGYDQYVLWRVDTVIDGLTYTGPTWYFMMQTTDFPPTVDAGYSYITWLGNLPQLLAGTVDDGGEGDVADADVVWSIISGPSGAAATVVKTSTDPLQPTAMFTTDKAGDYVIELTAADTNGSQGVQSASDRLTVRVAADACAAQQMVQSGYNAADYDRNCVVDLADLSAFARQWLDDIRLTEAVPY
jgi:hypothetical protein